MVTEWTAGAYRTDRPQRDRQAVFTMHRDGTSLKRITPWWLGASQPDYSPNGHWIVVRTHESSDTSGNLLLIARKGLQRHKVTHDPAGTAKWQSARSLPMARKSRPAAPPSWAVNSNRGLTSGQCGWMAPHMHNITQTPGKWESASDRGPRP